MNGKTAGEWMAEAESWERRCHLLIPPAILGLASVVLGVVSGFWFLVIGGVGILPYAYAWIKYLNATSEVNRIFYD